MLFAERIKAARDSLQLSQKEVAKAIGVDVPMYSRIERGQRPAKREAIPALSKLLGLDESELLKLWLAEKVYNYVVDEEDAECVLSIVAESIVEYKNKTK